jgi:transposase
MSTTATGSARPHDRAPEEKLCLLVEAHNLDDEALVTFEGIHKAHLEQWQRDVLSVIGAKPAKTKANVADMTAHNRIKELEVELHRKDKALAETAALLVLQKKARIYGGTRAEA